MKKIVLITSGIALTILFLGAIFLNEISHADDTHPSKKKINKNPIVLHTVKLEDKKVIPEEFEKHHKIIKEVDPPQQENKTTEQPKVSEKNKKNLKKEVMYTAIPVKDKIVALTFDDGPDKKYTAQVLKILKAYHVKATFFVIGKNVKENPAIMQQIISDGHAIGNHTWSHARLTALNANQIKVELNNTNQLLKEKFGVETDLMRPPFGAMDARTLKVLSDMGFYTIKWSVDTRDWDGTPTNAIIQNINGHITSGGIVLQHSAGGKGGNLDNTILALPTIIQDLQKKGYQFVTVPEMLQMVQ